MEEEKDSENRLTSAAAFVEGGIQEACDDACSICLEDFCESDPSTVTACKHEFHLQCILEWCQRSSQCPMCWQSISLKDPTSQELLEAVERERNIRVTPVRNTAVFHHPAIGNFELQHLPLGVTNAELEERIIQHLAAAAAMGRAHHMGRREVQRSQSSSHGRPHFLVFSTHPGGPPSENVSASEGGTDPAGITMASPSSPRTPRGDEPSQHIAQFQSIQTDQISRSASGSNFSTNRRGASSSVRISTSDSPSSNLDRAGPSEFQSFSESLKSRLNAASTRYKESISKSTRGWKERLFSRNSSMSELGSEVRREVNAGIASVSRMMQRLETRDDGVTNQDSNEPGGHVRRESSPENSLNDKSATASCAATSAER
ncbi:E3 ubiquitin-protein ligase RHF2A-like [Cucurbita moschata]|uniref:RING-type E3 ubiquitin transferase n=1 Tax=Cucurbita moschata TaxID=3662 RepID=A0A6J1F325_CUCMO|nr:E3 ubiquitin-protein ligase RHF2A-like [Cucurbita moschata]